MYLKYFITKRLIFVVSWRCPSHNGFTGNNNKISKWQWWAKILINRDERWGWKAFIKTSIVWVSKTNASVGTTLPCSIFFLEIHKIVPSKSNDTSSKSRLCVSISNSIIRCNDSCCNFFVFCWSKLGSVSLLNCSSQASEHLWWVKHFGRSWRDWFTRGL